MSSNSLSASSHVRLPTADLQLQEDADGGDEETAFPRESMNKLILNYFVTEGFREAAEKFKEESSLTCDIDFRTLEDRIKIRDAVQNGNIMEATNLVHEHHPELLDDDKPLHFQLQRQHLIELIRQGRIDDALAYSSDHLAERGEEEFGMLEELEKTLVLLAFEDPHRSPFADLMSELHRQKVASDLNSAILKAQHAETSEPKLATALKLLHWAQDQLEKENAKFNKVTNLVTSNVEEAKP